MITIEDLLKKLEQPTFTKTERKIADYIVENMDHIGWHTVTTLADEIGVSDTSVIRFARLLGYEGYAEFKREMAEHMRNRYQEALSPSEKYFQTRGTFNQSSLIVDTMRVAVDNIQKTCASLRIERINEVADCILSSRIKHVYGFRGAASCASYFYRKLLFLVPNVLCGIWAESTVLESVSDLTAEDCVLLYSFPRYSAIMTPILEIAKQKGAKTIAITDRPTSPLATGADIAIPVSITGRGLTNSYIAPMLISEIILLAVSERRNSDDSDNDQRLKMMEEYINKYRMY